MSNPTAGRPVDPRFDPAFQPGYDPQADPNRAARVSTQGGGGESLRMQPGRLIEPPRSRYAPPPTRTADATSLAPGSAQAPAVGHDSAPSAGIFSNSDAGNTPASEHASEAAPIRGRNPFLVALWVLGVVFIGIGMFTAQQVLDPTTDFMVAAIRGDTVNYFSVQLFTYGAPLLIVLGLTTITLALFLHALRWQGRSGR